MRITDFHTHVFPDELAQRAIHKLTTNAPQMRNRTDGTLSGLLRSMDEAEIDRSVILAVATRPEHVRSINENACSMQSERLVPFGALFPHDPDVIEDIKRISDAGLPGVKLHPEYQDFYVDDSRFDEMYAALEMSDLIVVFHAGRDPGPFSSDHATPHALARVARKFPRLAMVASHMGGYQCWDEAERELVGTNVYLDTSAVYKEIGSERFERMVASHGADRVLFGTDSPWFSQKESIDWVEELSISTEDKKKMLSGNAETLLGRR